MSGAVNIRRVGNGWVVTPAQDFQRDGRVTAEHEVFVFQTFTGLVEHLEQVLKAPAAERSRG